MQGSHRFRFAVDTLSVDLGGNAAPGAAPGAAYATFVRVRVPEFLRGAYGRARAVCSASSGAAAPLVRQLPLRVVRSNCSSARAPCSRPRVRSVSQMKLTCCHIVHRVRCSPARPPAAPFAVHTSGALTLQSLARCPAAQAARTAAASRARRSPAALTAPWTSRRSLAWSSRAAWPNSSR